jgi:hypothetical protein
MVATESVAAPGGMSPARLTVNLRRTSFATLVLLLIEFGLGMGVNLFVNVPSSDQGVGTGRAFGKAFSGPPAIATHAGIGVLLFLGAVMLAVRAVQSRRRVVTVASIVALLAILGAGTQGAQFVSSGQNADSMTMAVLTLVALVCYAVNLFVLGAPAGSADERAGNAV